MKKFITMFLALAMTASMTACGSGSSTEDTTAAETSGTEETEAADGSAAEETAEAADTAAGTGSGVEDGVLTVGMECAYAPYNWTQMDDSNGAVPISNVPGSYANGYDVMIAKQICEANGWELEVVSSAWDSLVPAVQSGTIDAAIAGQSMTADEVFICDFLKGELTVKMLAHIPLCLEDGYSHGAVAVHGKAPRIGAVKLNQDGHKERNAAGDEKVLLQSVFLRHFMKQGQDSGIDLLIQLNHMGKICRSLDENGNQLCFLDVGHEQIAGNGYHITAVGLFENMEGVAFKTADENQRTLFQRVGLVINYGRGLSGCDENHLVFKMCSRHGQAVGHLIRVKTADVGNMGVKHKALGSPFCFIDSL